ncbi:MAG: undecaprenyl-diphosphate phosphatase [Coriobacteriia bacterium]|nr:undecaprenyl-diphosphate phosphatase [Coriobacteriia bacterium]
MDHVWAVILGAAQGLAEFLPISSSAHLKMLPWLFGIEGEYAFLADASKAAAFDISLHAGSAIAVMIALWSDWVRLLAGAVKRDAEGVTSRRFLLFLLATSVPGALIGVALDDQIETFSTPAFITAAGVQTGFRYAPLVVGVALIVFGVLLWWVDRTVKRSEPLESMNWGKAFAIGFAQALALVPGVSRSGSTMTAGRLLGFSRDATARYSFMAALPIIAGAAVFGLRDIPLSELLSIDWILGFAASAITSVLFMKWMLGYVRNHSFAVFMWYRIAAGLLLIAVFFSRG